MDSVLFLSVDCLRADHVGCYGYDRPTTPNIDAFAEEGALFEHTYANCPGTRWAFQALHTGLWTSQIDGLGIPPGYTGVLARQFQEHGYGTGGFTKNGFLSRDYNYDDGFDELYDISRLQSREHILRRVGRKLDKRIDSYVFRDKILRPIKGAVEQARSKVSGSYTPDIPDREVTDIALDWIADQQSADRPFFCWVHFMDAHTPYGRWPEHLEALRGDTDVEHTIHPGDEGLVTVDGETPQRVIDTYDAGIRSSDEQIGRLLDAVDDDTVVVITGDHGEEFGRFNVFHEASLYSTFSQVPLIIRAPEMDAETRSEPAQHLDIPPTLLTAIGENPYEDWQGVPLQTADRDNQTPIFFDLGENERAVRVGDWKLIEVDGSRRLYNVPHSGAESEEVSEQYPEKLAELAELLEKHPADSPVGTLSGATGSLTADSNELSNDVEDNLEQLGYL